MYYRALALCLVGLSVLHVSGATRTPILIHTLVPYNNPSFSADGVVPAMDLAVDDVNNGSFFTYLQNYSLVLIKNDTQVSE